MHNRDLSQVLSSFSDLRIIVAGDVMVDAYLFGKVERISPEAPVPIVSVERRVNRLGGAANVALNLKAIGAVPLLCSVIGQDQKGEEFIKLMEEAGISNKGIIRSKDRITTTKFRVIGNNAQMLRVDEEVTGDIMQEEQAALMSFITREIDHKPVHAIILQDYNKGVLTTQFIKDITEKARVHGIPVIVDPKRKNFSSYQGIALFKPNLKELKEGLNLENDLAEAGQLEDAAGRLHREQGIHMVMVTLSDKGVFISKDDREGKGCVHTIAAHKRSIADVSGAGDSVVSVAAACLASGMSAWEIAFVSNIAGGLVCEDVGVVPVEFNRLVAEVKRLLSK